MSPAARDGVWMSFYRSNESTYVSCTQVIDIRYDRRGNLVVWIDGMYCPEARERWGHRLGMSAAQQRAEEARLAATVGLSPRHHIEPETR